MLPEPLQKLTQELGRLPGVGPKTALRYAYDLFYRRREEAVSLARMLLSLHDHVLTCSLCGNLTETDPCRLCSDRSRERGVLCVVAEARDINAMERTRAYRGQYFVLGGVISPLDGSTPEKLRGGALHQRLDNEPAIKEIVLAFNPNIEGETTILYLVKMLRGRLVKISRLARGLPLGGELEYADDVTLSEAFKGRRDIASG